MDNDLVRVFVAAAVATFNPSLLAAVTVMLLLPHPKRLMLGYLLGAYTTSLAVGLAVVFSLHGSGALRTSKRTLTPEADLLIGAVVLAITLVLAPSPSWADLDPAYRPRKTRRIRLLCGWRTPARSTSPARRAAPSAATPRSR